MPEPDLAWAIRRDYSNRRPEPQDVLLVIEVSDSSLSYDRKTKAALYAEAGIADYWIVNVAARRVEVFRDPSGNRYESIVAYGPGEPVRPLAFPGLSLSVSRLFGIEPAGEST
jgi:Uma2 family endonuclease